MGAWLCYMSIVLRFFPNGEFSQGVSASSKSPHRHVCKQLQTSIATQIYTNADLHRCKEQNADIPANIYATEGYLFHTTEKTVYSLLQYTETSTTLRCESGFYKGKEVHIDASIYRLVHLRLLVPLGLSDARILTESLPGRKKLLSMTRNMGRNLRNVVYLMEEKYGKEQLSFLTLTLPNLSREGLSLCCANWDVMVNTFTKWLRTRVELKCMELEYAYCTEIQPGRLKNRGEYAPHLHIVFRGKAYNKQAWAVSWIDCRNTWAGIISKFVNESFDTRALENIQRVKKSAARYLSKYLSKGKNIIPQGTEEDAPIQQLHTQWGGMSRNLSRDLKKRIIRFTNESGLGSLATEIVQHIDGLIEAGIVRYFNRRFISLGISAATGSEYGLHVGVGAFTSPTCISLPECLRFIASV